MKTANARTQTLTYSLGKIDNQVISSFLDYGFSKAINQGIAESNGKYVCILNPDTIVNNDSIKILLDYLSKNKEIAIWIKKNIKDYKMEIHKKILDEVIKKFTRKKYFVNLNPRNKKMINFYK